MSLEKQEHRERRRHQDKIDRELIRDFLSIITNHLLAERGIKYSRSEALREVLLERYTKESDPFTHKAILMVDQRRALKDEKE